MKYLWILPFLFFFAGYYGALHMVRMSETTVPHVTGLSLHEGMMLISAAHMSARMLREHEDQHMPAGIIVQQFPDQGTCVKIRSPLDLVVSKKPTPPRAPMYQGSSHDHVMADAAQHHMRIREHWLEMGGLTGIAHAQYPTPEVPLSDNIIYVYFSSGPIRYVLMPDLRGKILSDARNLLVNNNMKVQVLMNHPLQLEHHQTTVLDQKPRANTIIDLRKPPLIQLIVTNESCLKIA
jgi:beta-lactam-binding protein with PASTA domain